MRLLTGASFFGLQGDADLGLAPMALSDGPTGVKGLSGTAPASLLPNASALASTWDEALLHEAGELLADEAVRQGVDVVLGPTINLHRSPLGGRLFECFSEDPLLTGRLAAALVRGLQGRGVGACLKHLVGNEAETERHTVDVRIDEATLREVYLLPFEIAVADANPWMLMAAYNRVNGVPATEQDAVINGVVKGEWSYDGVVVSDWFATTLHRPGDHRRPRPRDARARWAPGATPWCGPWRTARCRRRRRRRRAPPPAPGRADRRPRWAAGDGGRRRQPTDAGRRARPAPVRRRRDDRAGQRRRAAPGARRAGSAGRRPGRETLLQGGGSAQVTPPSQASILDGLEAALPERVTYAGGVEIGSPPPARPGFVVDPVDGRPGMRVQLIAADGEVLLEEHVVDARRLVGIGDDVPAPGRAVRLAARIESPGPLQLGVIGIGTWTVDAGGAHRTVAVAPVSGMPGEAILAPPTQLLDLAVDGPVARRGRARARRRPRAWSGWSPGRPRCRTSRRSRPPSPPPGTPTSRSSSWG